jgi:phenylacetate-CoA ligase
MLIIRGVNVFPSQVEEVLLKIPALAPHYVLEVSREGHLDSLTVHVEAADGVLTWARDTAAAELAQQVKAFIGVTVRVRVGERDSVERSIGKAKRVIDRRGEPKS